MSTFFRGFAPPTDATHEALDTAVAEYGVTVDYTHVSHAGYPSYLTGHVTVDAPVDLVVDAADQLLDAEWYVLAAYDTDNPTGWDRTVVHGSPPEPIPSV